MVQHVRTFINEAFVCAVNGFYDSFQGFFAHFLCHTVDTVLKQTRSSGISLCLVSIKSCNSLRNVKGLASFFSPQQVSVPVWHTGPSGCTRMSSVSWSQSFLMETTCKKFPLVSPLVHSRFLLRLKNVHLVEIYFHIYNRCLICLF